MSLADVAERIGTTSKDLRSFLRDNPAWDVVDFSNLDPSSVNVISEEFLKWEVKRGRAVIPKPDLKPEHETFPVEMLTLPIGQRPMARIRTIALEQEKWLEKRLSDIGLSISQKTHDPSWRPLQNPGKQKEW